MCYSAHFLYSLQRMCKRNNNNHISQILNFKSPKLTPHLQDPLKPLPISSVSTHTTSDRTEEELRQEGAKVWMKGGHLERDPCSVPHCRLITGSGHACVCAVALTAGLSWLQGYGVWEGVLVWKASVCKCHYGIEMFGEATGRREGGLERWMEGRMDG